MPPDKRAWTDDEVKAEIAAAVKIVAEDRERAEYARLHGLYGQVPDNPDDPKPPPKNDPADPPKPKKSLWWGEVQED